MKNLLSTFENDFKKFINKFNKYREEKKFEKRDNKISIRINGLKTDDKDIDAKISIEKGLKPERGNTPTAEAIVNSFTIPSPFVLTIQNVEAEHDGTDGVVKVTTSQQLNGESLKSFIRFDPDLVYTVEANDYGFTLRSDKFDVEKSYALTIAKGLRGKIGGVLKEDYNGGVAFGELEANINFTNSKAVYLSKNGGRNMEVQITNVPKVKLIISKIYENNLLLAQRYGYTPKETRQGPDYASYGEEYEGDYYDDEYGSGDAMLGDVDLSATVSGNGTYNFQWTGGLAGQDNLQFNDLQVGLRVWFE